MYEIKSLSNPQQIFIKSSSNPHEITSNILPLNHNTISRPRRLDLSLQPLPDSIFWQQSGKLSTTNNTQVIVTT